MAARDTEGLAGQQALNDHGSSGFRSFWKKGSKNEQGQEATFVSQDPSSRDKGGRLRRLLTGSSSASSEGKGGGSGTQSEAQKRRQQVYQAQKRHRNRKAEYIQSLEAEIARLRHLDSEVNSEKNSLSHQNKAMRDLLASQSLDARLDTMDLSASAPGAENPSASVNLRYDSDIEQERWFIDLLNSEDMLWTSSETSGVESPDKQPSRSPSPSDSWAALDFILALEHPCRNHVPHPAIHPSACLPDPSEAHCHAMTATAAVFASAQAPPAPNSHHGSKEPEKWQLPHSEIEKLVELSEGLELKEADITPAQAYSAIRDAVPSAAYLRPTLETLKQPLAQLVKCVQFGSTLDTVLFWQHFNATLETLRLTRPELG